MTHPLYVLAKAFDAHLASQNYKGHFSSNVKEALLERDYDQAVSCYAAQCAVLTQACQLGGREVHEEPQTAALFGLLASAFWHASILTEAHAASDEKFELDLKQWVYQDKGQEASFGYDFGIVANGPDGMKKITLFQAKRAENATRLYQIDTGHTVKAKKRIEIPRTIADAKAQKKAYIEEKKNKNLKEERKQALQSEIEFLTSLLEENTPENTAMRQRDALTWLIGRIAGGASRDSLTNYLKRPENSERKKYLLEKGKNRLCTARYSYDQVEAFLATALQGWLTSTTGSGDPPNWCHYVQWVNGGAGFPWSIPIDQAIRAGDQPVDNPAQFSDILARALYFFDLSIGWVVTADESPRVVQIIRDNHPKIMWAVTADTAEMGRELLLSLGVPADRIVPALRESSEQTRDLLAEVATGVVHEP